MTSGQNLSALNTSGHSFRNTIQLTRNYTCKIQQHTGKILPRSFIAAS